MNKLEHCERLIIDLLKNIPSGKMLIKTDTSDDDVNFKRAIISLKLKGIIKVDKDNQNIIMLTQEK